MSQKQSNQQRQSAVAGLENGWERVLTKPNHSTGSALA
jgi:hypothetical protein